MKNWGLPMLGLFSSETVCKGQNWEKLQEWGGAGHWVIRPFAGDPDVRIML